MSKNDFIENGANPAQAHMELNPDNQAVGYHSGLTKREHFAGLAMQGLLAADATYGGVTNDNLSLSRNSIEVADALLKELEK